MKQFKLLSLLIFLLIYSCNQGEPSNSVTEKTPLLGEDKEEINCYVTNIYEIQGIMYVDLDFVIIEYINIDEKQVVNKNLKVKTYIVNSETLIYSDDCTEITPKELVTMKERLTADKSIITVGSSENGKMISINFGCYG